MVRVLEVHVTAPNQGQAEEMARALVVEKLAACVNLVAGVRSIYIWDGDLREDDEVLCLIKTRPDLLNALITRVSAMHPYQVPAILAFEVVDGSPAYFDWLAASTRPA